MCVCGHVCVLSISHTTTHLQAPPSNPLLPTPAALPPRQTQEAALQRRGTAAAVAVTAAAQTESEASVAAVGAVVVAAEVRRGPLERGRCPLAWA